VNLTSTRYAFMSAYLKGEESRTVTSDHIGEVVQRSATMQDAFEIIGDTDIGEYLLDQPITTFDHADEHLWLYLDECLGRLEGFDMPRDMLQVARLYTEKYDVLNIGTALRVILKKTPASPVPVGTIHSGGCLEELSAVRERDELISLLARCNLGRYIRTIEEINEKDPQSVSEGEVALQNLYHQMVLGAFRGMADGHLLEQAFRIGIDVANLRTVFRVSLGGNHSTGAPALSGGRMLSEDDVQELLTLKLGEITGRLEGTGYHAMVQEVSKGYEKGGEITAVDKITEKHRFRMLRDLLSTRILSTSNMLWYLLLKELEVRNLRLTFKVLADGIPAAEIKDLVIAA